MGGDNRRPWYWDALASLAFYGQAIFLGKAFARINPILGLFVLAINAALGYYFGRAAWRSLTDARERNR